MSDTDPTKQCRIVQKGDLAILDEVLEKYPGSWDRDEFKRLIDEAVVAYVEDNPEDVCFAWVMARYAIAPLTDEMRKLVEALIDTPDENGCFDLESLFCVVFSLILSPPECEWR